VIWQTKLRLKQKQREKRNEPRIGTERGGHRRSIGEDISDMGESETVFKIVLKLRIPIRVAEINFGGGLGIAALTLNRSDSGRYRHCHEARIGVRKTTAITVRRGYAMKSDHVRHGSHHKKESVEIEFQKSLLLLLWNVLWLEWDDVKERRDNLCSSFVLLCRLLLLCIAECSTSEGSGEFLGSFLMFFNFQAILHVPLYIFFAVN